MFLLFVGYGIWCVVLHGMPTPRSKLLVTERYFLNFIWLCEENDAKLLNGGKMCLVGRGDKYLMMTKAKHFGFLDSNSFQFCFVVWKLSRGMPKAYDFN